MNINIKSLSTEYEVKRLNEDNISEIYALCQSNPTYYQYCPPALTVDGIHSDMTILPPGKKRDEKFYIGFYKKDCLIAIMDFIDGYPDSETVFIGLFMVHNEFSGNGIGRSIISDACNYFKKSTYLRVKLGYAKGNSQSRKFWIKNQFVEIGKETQADGYIVVGMERCLL